MKMIEKMEEKLSKTQMNVVSFIACILFVAVVVLSLSYAISHIFNQPLGMIFMIVSFLLGMLGIIAAAIILGVELNR